MENTSVLEPLLWNLFSIFHFSFVVSSKEGGLAPALGLDFDSFLFY